MHVHPDDCGLLEESAGWLRLHPGETKNIEARVRHKNGAWRWVEITSRNLLDEPGVRAIVSNVRDITDRKIAEETLRESENKFKNLVEESSVGVYLIQDGVFQYVNAKFAEVHGYDESEMAGRVKVAETMLPEDQASFGREDQVAARAGPAPHKAIQDSHENRADQARRMLRDPYHVPGPARRHRDAPRYYGP